MTELWNWKVDDDLVRVEVYQALAESLGRPVVPLGAHDPGRIPIGAVLADVWCRPGEFALSIDCYGPPAGLVEHVAVAALSRRLDRRCLLVDDTYDGGRHLLIGPDGTVRPVHFDVLETDDGEVLSNQRLCSTAEPGCRGWSLCGQSRWAPDSVLPALVAA
ncbi:hypothetical protein [Plantactinospora sp. KBS50]|uniref:hypothetical protein n=1 Tax=Plantactinospora sp. KBS50 TaxID=2024580 RepID=UPI000BAAA558|nr:hypothetical protein [Plantactinospora sp. KBS50]ASW54126.1 hypothetical protein CIK06_07860 [Plantactinospora sp. KBS50]